MDSLLASVRLMRVSKSIRLDDCDGYLFSNCDDVVLPFYMETFNENTCTLMRDDVEVTNWK